MASNRLILAFDTSAAHCAAALLCGNTLLAEKREEMARGQAERLMPMLGAMLEKEGLAYSDLDALAVGTGPGNFTGLRIAIAAARGLALALRRPAHGISGFSAIGYTVPGPVLACLPAPREAAYILAVGTDSAMPPRLVGLDDVAALDLPPVIPCAGPAAVMIATATGRSVVHDDPPTAEAIARIAAGRSDHAVSRPAPIYVRPADAAPPREPPLRHLP